MTMEAIYFDALLYLTDPRHWAQTRSHHDRLTLPDAIEFVARRLVWDQSRARVLAEHAKDHLSDVAGEPIERWNATHSHQEVLRLLSRVILARKWVSGVD